jgi:hypothetical protein
MIKKLSRKDPSLQKKKHNINNNNNNNNKQQQQKPPLACCPIGLPYMTALPHSRRQRRPPSRQLRQCGDERRHQLVVVDKNFPKREINEVNPLNN